MGYGVKVDAGTAVGGNVGLSETGAGGAVAHATESESMTMEKATKQSCIAFMFHLPPAMGVTGNENPAGVIASLNEIITRCKSDVKERIALALRFACFVCNSTDHLI